MYGLSDEIAGLSKDLENTHRDLVKLCGLCGDTIVNTLVSKLKETSSQKEKMEISDLITKVITLQREYIGESQ